MVEATPFPAHDKLLYHIDEGMSWECVRDLQRMRKALLLVRNLVAQHEVPSEIAECTAMVVDEYQATVEELGGT